MPDHLAPLPVQQVAAWYRRLADQIGQQQVGGQAPLASVFLRHYLDNRDPNSTFQFSPPRYLCQSPHVIAVLRFHRAVFLTQQQARFSGGRRSWAGVIPRLRGRSGFTRWDLSRPLDMHYESLVEVGGNIIEIARIQRSGTPEERDLFTALRGFQLRSRVILHGARLANSMVRITFVFWMSRARDRYDFDYTEHLTVPNPDYGSTQPDAVRPQDQTFRVYHSNARRLVEARLAAPYNIESNEWSVFPDQHLCGTADVNPQRRL